MRSFMNATESSVLYDKVSEVYIPDIILTFDEINNSVSQAFFY